MLIRLQKRLSNPPRPSGMSYSCSSIVSMRPVSRARSKERPDLADAAVGIGLVGVAGERLEHRAPDDVLEACGRWWRGTPDSRRR